MKINFLQKRIDKSLKSDICLASRLVFLRLKQDDALEVNIEFIGEKEMRELNFRMRGVDSVTDVLSFPNYNLKPFENIDTSEGTAFLGDIAICLKRAEEQAKEYGNTLQIEVVKLVIHSLLHLMGFDHIKDSDYAVMNKVEEEVMQDFLKNKN